MTRELYTALKKRISVTPFTKEDQEYYDLQGWTIRPGAIHYRFHLDDLGEDYFDYCHMMMTKNIWNVAQRFWSLIGNEELETLLLNC